MITGAAAPVTVVIPTRDRGGSVLMTLRSLLTSSYPADFEVSVVDQSEGDATEIAVKRWRDDARIHYTRSATRGLSAALNCGIGRATSEAVAITGDDCEVATDWLRALVAALSIDSRIGIVFGNILSAPHDRTRGFVPGYVRREPVLARGIQDAHLLGGTSASMALRRSAWQRLGGFDETLGVGTPLGSAEDTDLTIRALLEGYRVYETPHAAVVHHGFFRWDQRLPLIQRNWYGTGAAFAKSLRHGHVAVLQVIARLGWRWMLGQVSPVATTLGPPARWSMLRAFARGFAAGVVAPIDRASARYR